MKSEKPEELARRGTPEQPTVKGYVACSASPFCRYPGRMWVPGLMANQRICVEHYAQDPRRHEEVERIGIPSRDVRKTP